MKTVDYSILPKHMQGGMCLYIEKGIRPGRFLQSLLENKLVNSLELADDINRHRLLDYAIFLINEAPRGCWGGPDSVAAWIEKQGMMQYEVATDA